MIHQHFKITLTDRHEETGSQNITDQKYYDFKVTLTRYRTHLDHRLSLKTPKGEETYQLTVSDTSAFQKLLWQTDLMRKEANDRLMDTDVMLNLKESHKPWDLARLLSVKKPLMGLLCTLALRCGLERFTCDMFAMTLRGMRGLTFMWSVLRNYLSSFISVIVVWLKIWMHWPFGNFL